jgi:hypothetical protein
MVIIVIRYSIFLHYINLLLYVFIFYSIYLVII